ncbi:neprilysin-like [Homalodisca vitripennis]|uniref:neprilysin-like n=1 Tax=Homalodisca vitripennis TaxID=197043 RepID=UPI001EE9C79E|nr:neprilysin-like [Homalodisca vitripennis]
MMFLLLNHDDYERNPALRDTKLRFEKELDETTIFKLELNKHQKAYWAEKDPIDIYNPMTMQRIQSEFPYVEWKEFFRRMLPKSMKIPNEIIVVGSSYFTSIKDLLLKTSKRTIANFLMVENCLEASLFLPKQYFATYNKFTTQIGIPNVKRSQVCDKILQTTLKGALSSLFLQTYVFTEESQHILNEIAIAMKENMKKNIDSLEWMDEKTKEEAFLKLKNVRFALSLSDDEIHELQDAEARAKYFEDLCLGRQVSHVLPSYFCVNKYLLNKNWELLSRKPTVFDKDIDVFSKGITYDQKRNSLLAVYGVLKYPAFDGIWPMYMNYGGIGSVLGTAFTNGFDISGSNYNYMGFKSKWWTAETENLYNKQCECFEKEYEVYAQNLTGLTLIKWDSKDICTQVSKFEGVNLAYQAYKTFLQTRFLKEQSLPGFEDFTAEQLFFISYANIGCGYYRIKKLQSVLTKGNDIIYEYRIIGSLQSLQEFSEVFQCKHGNKMNPEKKCKFLF